ncbi:MAG: efflux RND transporter periplasmic adaptor subunit [Bacteroidales bacterium]
MKAPAPFIIFILFIVANSCTRSAADSDSKKNLESTQQPAPVMVTTAQAVTKTFYHELLCNGTLEAASNARMGFEVGGTIAEVLVKSGELVQKGQLLAKLNNLQQQMAVERARNNLMLAKVEMADILLGYSSTRDTVNIPPQVMQTVRIKSGYIDAELALREAEFQLSKTLITAPIAGRIVNLQAKPNNPTSNYEYCCQIIDEQSFQVVFTVLETELQFAAPETEVVVFPFSNPKEHCNGRITEVNRIIDKNGMVKVVARLSKPSSCFIAGMNVRVLVRKPMVNQLVIPTEGLTQRQNRDVVFVMHDTLAHWQYVDVGPRNSTEAVILSGIKSGDKVIISGNATIGHEAWVREIQ